MDILCQENSDYYFLFCSEDIDIVGAAGRSPADGNGKSDTGDGPAHPYGLIFMRQRVRHKAREGLLRNRSQTTDSWSYCALNPGLSSESASTSRSRDTDGQRNSEKR
jgi:hypothetical protein